jgi:hypothetical protein
MGTRLRQLHSPANSHANAARLQHPAAIRPASSAAAAAAARAGNVECAALARRYVHHYRTRKWEQGRLGIGCGGESLL